MMFRFDLYSIPESRATSYITILAGALSSLWLKQRASRAHFGVNRGGRTAKETAARMCVQIESRL
jgi:hypothetical protein